MTTEGRVLPQDREAERAVLAAMLTDQDALDLLAPVCPAPSFHQADHRAIREAIADLHETQQPVDAVTLVSRLRAKDRVTAAGGVAYIANLTDAVPSYAPRHLEAYAKRVRDLWRVRQMIGTCQRIAAEGYGEIDDAKSWLERAESDVFEVAASVDSGKRSRRIKHPIREVAAKLQAMWAEGRTVAGIRTGLADLDATLLGIQRGRLYTVAGRPGMGKSAFAQSLALGLSGTTERDDALPLGALYVSCEMPEEEVAVRAVAECGRVDARVLHGGNRTASDDEWRAINAGAQEASSRPFWTYDATGPSLLDVRAEVRRVKAEAQREHVDLAVVVVDYLQLMRGTGREQSREQEIAGITRGLKAMAKELDVAIVALSQLSRRCEERNDKRPMLSDLRESGAIEQDSDVVLLLYRDSYYRDETPENRNVLEVDVAKNRGGTTGVIKVHADMSCGHFTNLARDEWS